MVPAFGFSVGDFIATIELITKVTKALDSRAGASNEYQQVQLELQALERTLRYLQALKSNEHNVTHVDAVRAMALTCRIPLQMFIKKMEKFKSSMSSLPRPVAGPLKSFGRKSQWALVMTEEITKLRMAMGAKVLSIQLLLATHMSDSLSGLRAQSQSSHMALMEKIIEQRTTLADVGRDTRAIRKSVDKLAVEQNMSNIALDQKIDGVTVILESVTSTISTELMSFRDLGAQLTDVIHRWPKQVLDTLKQIVQSNLQMYAMLRVIHTNTLRSPQYDPADTFRLEDVLGRSHNLPYQYFRHKTVFDSFLQNEFRGVPGEGKVKQKQYLIFDDKSGQELIGDNEWASRVFPGSRLTMSIFMELLTDSIMEKQCPRTSCSGLGIRQQRQSRFVKCKECGMEFLYSLQYPRVNRYEKAEVRIDQAHTITEIRANDAERDEDSIKTQARQFYSSSIFRPFKEGESEDFIAAEQTRQELSVFRRTHFMSLDEYMQSYEEGNELNPNLWRQWTRWKGI